MNITKQKWFSSRKILHSIYKGMKPIRHLDNFKFLNKVVMQYEPSALTTL